MAIFPRGGRAPPYPTASVSVGRSVQTPAAEPALLAM